MKLIKKENLENNIVSLEIQVEKDEFEKALNEAYNKNKNQISVQGFRKGKAPRKMIERVYGAEIFYDDAINIAFPDAYSKALEEADISPIEQGNVELKEISADGFTFTAKAPVAPEAKVNNYKGLSAEKKEAEVTESDIDAEIERLRNRNSTVEKVERAAENGDTVNIDFEGFVDGVPFEGGKGEKYDLVLGSGSFIPGFEDQLIGVSAGDHKEVNVTFPEEYQAEELKGKAAVFVCTINEVKETILPAIDDEFAKDVTEDCDTIDQLKEKIKNQLLESRQNEYDQDYEEAILDELLKNVEVDVPDAMVKNQEEQIVEDFSMRMQMQGLTLDQYLQFTNTTKEAFMDQYKDQALRSVKINLALTEIAKLENIEITDDKVEAEMQRLADSYKMKIEDVKASVKPNLVRKDLLVAEALKIVKDNAVAKKAETEEAAE